MGNTLSEKMWIEEFRNKWKYRGYRMEMNLVSLRAERGINTKTALIVEIEEAVKVRERLGPKRKRS